MRAIDRYAAHETRRYRATLLPARYACGAARVPRAFLRAVQQKRRRKDMRAQRAARARRLMRYGSARRAAPCRHAPFCRMLMLPARYAIFAIIFRRL